MQRPVLTAVNQPVVVLLVSFRAVASSLEVDGSHALGATRTIVVERHVLERAHCCVEELL